MSSIVGFQGMPNAAHYAATKAYVQVPAEALYVELSPLGIDVLASAPGPTNSGFAARAGMRMGKVLSPAGVARPTLDALGRRSTVLPGFLSKLLTYSLIPLPRGVRVRIMVLELKVPLGDDWAALRSLVPVFLTYVLSFVFLGIYWVNRHHMLQTVEQVSGGVLWANLHLLFWLSLVPFVTGWMDENHFAAVPTAL